MPLIAAALIAAALVAGLSAWEYRSEREHAGLAFERRVDAHVDRLRDHVQSRVNTARVVAAVLTPDDGITAHALSGWDTSVLPLLPDVFSFVWVGRVPASRVPEALEALRRTGVASPRLLGPGARPLEPAAGEAHRIVLDIVPKTPANLSSLGLDLAALPHPREALERAAVSGLPAATRPLQLVQLPERPAIVIYAPVHDAAGVILGFVGFAYRIDELVSAALGGEIDAMPFRVRDRDDDGQGVVFQRGDVDTAASTRTVAVAGRTWQLEYPVPRAIDEQAAVSALRVAGLSSAALGLLFLIGWSLSATNRRLARAVAARAEAEQRLHLSLEAAETGLWSWDLRTDAVAWSPECLAILGVASADFHGSRSVLDGLVHPEDRARVGAAVRAAVEQKGRYACEFRIVRPDGRESWVANVGRVVCDRDQRPIRMLGTITDVTSRKTAEQHLRLLMREVNHRAKNQLMLVLAIARRTAAATPADFLSRFSERVQALAANQDLLVETYWSSIEIERLTRAQLAPLGDLIGGRIALAGPALRLNSGAAQGIGLALHELATNAAKYGALSNDAGRVDIRWALEGDLFSMTWAESLGPPVAKPCRKGFGTTVVTSMVAMFCPGASATLEHAASGMEWRMTCPASAVLAADAPGRA